MRLCADRAARHAIARLLSPQLSGSWARRASEFSMLLMLNISALESGASKQLPPIRFWNIERALKSLLC
jgi:hypothetical protein